MGDQPAVTESSPAPQRDQRVEPRLKLPAMYTLARVRRLDEPQYRWTGHIYDISLSGMRFEIDEVIEVGSQIEMRAMLPGHRHTLLRVTGRIVRVHEDEPIVAPVRMGMAFEAFANSIDRHRLERYLAAAGLQRPTPAPKRIETPRRRAA